MFKFIECRHIMPNGRRCRAAALRGKPFCFHHAKLHFRSSFTPKPGKRAQLSVDDLSGLQSAAPRPFELYPLPSPTPDAQVFFSMVFISQPTSPNALPSHISANQPKLTNLQRTTLTASPFHQRVRRRAT